MFPGENETDQLSCIMEIFGMPPNNMIEEAKRKRIFFGKVSCSPGQHRISVRTGLTPDQKRAI